MLMRNYRKDGQAFLNELHPDPVRDAEDQLTHYMAVLSDQTERHRQAEALRLSEERTCASRSTVLSWGLRLGPGFRRRLFLGDGRPCRPADAATVGPYRQLLGPCPRKTVRRSGPRSSRQPRGHVEMEHRLRRTDHSLIWVRNRGKVVQRDPSGLALPLGGAPWPDITTPEAQANESAARSPSCPEQKSEFLSPDEPRDAHAAQCRDRFRRPAQAGARHPAPAAARICRAHLPWGRHSTLTNDVLDLQQTEAGICPRTPVCPAEGSPQPRLSHAGPAGRQAQGRHALGVCLRGAAAWGRPAPAPASADEPAVQRHQVQPAKAAGCLRAEQRRLALAPVGGGPAGGPDWGGKTSSASTSLSERLGKETSGIEGTGLGLLITRSLLQAMGGEILIDSETGGGARIRISLPGEPRGCCPQTRPPMGRARPARRPDPIPQPPWGSCWWTTTPSAPCCCANPSRCSPAWTGQKLPELDAACAAAASQAFDLWSSMASEATSRPPSSPGDVVVSGGGADARHRHRRGRASAPGSATCRWPRPLTLRP